MSGTRTTAVPLGAQGFKVGRNAVLVGQSEDTVETSSEERWKQEGRGRLPSGPGAVPQVPSTGGCRHYLLQKESLASLPPCGESRL